MIKQSHFSALFLLFLTTTVIAVSGSVEKCLPEPPETYNLMSLLSASNKTAECLSESRAAFAHSYKNSSFFIRGPLVVDEQSAIDETNKPVIHLKHMKTIRGILDAFGDMIQFISITFYYLSEAQGKELISNINTNRTQSLLQFELIDCYGSVLESMIKPHPKAYMLSFSTNPTREFKINASTISSTFPRLKRLFVKIFYANDWKFVGSRFPHLNSLLLELPVSTSNGRPFVESLFQNSQNIKSLSISSSSLKIVKAASDFLPKLNSLQISDITNELYRGGAIQFRNVHTLDLSISNDNFLIPRNLVVNQVRMLTLSLEFDLNDEWIHFFHNIARNNLFFLDLVAYSFTVEQLTIIVENQRHIKYAQFRSRKKVSPVAILNFVANSEHLQHLSLEMTGWFDVTEREYLENILDEKWHVDFDYVGLNSFSVALKRLSKVIGDCTINSDLNTDTH